MASTADDANAASLASIQRDLRAMSAKTELVLQAQESRIQDIDAKLDRLLRAVEEGVGSLEKRSNALPDSICRPLARRWADTSQVVDEALQRMNQRLDRIEKDLDELPDKLQSRHQASSITLPNNEGFWPTTSQSSTSTPSSQHLHTTSVPTSHLATNHHPSQRRQHLDMLDPMSFTPRPSQVPSHYTTFEPHMSSSAASLHEDMHPSNHPPSSNALASSFRATTCRTMWHLWFHGDPATPDVGPLRHVALDESAGGSTRMQQSRTKVVMETLLQLGRVSADAVAAMSTDDSNALFDRAFHAMLFDNPDGNLAGAVGKLRPDKAESYMVATVYNVLVNERRKRKRDAVEIHML
ncbi:hypothetical protein DYB28_010016 [Aphanomyces astaci]|uniref:Uncharacterized protein n=1 Tax=Aphanomyces astaci TaxID=112090 RepID=A0A9X8E5H7_APHAT|nr:hypothetical protein DYB28_010016 [Aphanomyces astaci]